MVNYEYRSGMCRGNCKGRNGQPHNSFGGARSIWSIVEYIPLRAGHLKVCAVKFQRVASENPGVPRVAPLGPVEQELAGNVRVYPNGRENIGLNSFSGVTYRIRSSMRQQRVSPACKDRRSTICFGSRSKPFSCKAVLNIAVFLPIQLLVCRCSARSEKAPGWCRTRENAGDSMKIIGVKAAKM